MENRHIPEKPGIILRESGFGTPEEFFFYYSWPAAAGEFLIFAGDNPKICNGLLFSARMRAPEKGVIFMSERLLLVILFALGGLLLFSHPLLAPEPPEPAGEEQNSLLLHIELFIRNYQPALSQGDLNEIMMGILESSERYRIDPRLITSLIAAESGFRKTAVSRMGARGLTQVMPDKIDGFDWREARPNINCGTAYLRKMLDRFNSVPLALAAYNAGPTRIAKNDEWPRETRFYVSRVLTNYEELLGK